MYYKSVNRGLSFTKPGIYAFGLVLIVGLVAVASGLNGLFVFLSAGLGGFIISGLLSERAMKSCRMTSVAATLTDAHQPFEVIFTMQNRSRWFTVYSMRGLFTMKRPRFRLISRDLEEVAGIRIASISPLTTESFRAYSQGMPRGEYRSVLAMQLTTFPFGILEKFKLNQVPAAIIVAPAVDQELLDSLRLMLKHQFRQEDSYKEFFGHRGYFAKESMKNVDWKKSAGRPTSDWVMKVYKDPSQQKSLIVRALLREAAALPSAAAYEMYLSKIRTVLAALEEAHRPWQLDLGNDHGITSLAAAQSALAALPTFDQRATLLSFVGENAKRNQDALLLVTPAAIAWGTTPSKSAAEKAQ